MTVDELVAKISLQFDQAAISNFTSKFHGLSHVISHAFHGAEEGPEKLAEGIEGVNRKLEFLAATEVVKGLYELTEKFANFAGETIAAADSAGITTDALQGLQYAASHSAVSADTVTGSIARLSKQLYEARNGSAEAQESFRAVGIPMSQVMSFHSGADALEAFADRMKEMHDPIAKEALSMRLLGRGGYGTVAWLSKGGKVMHELTKEAITTGAVLRGPQLHALLEVEEAAKSAGHIFKVLAGTFAADLAPSVKYLVGYFTAFYQANKKLIDVNLHKWAEIFMFDLGFMVGFLTVVVNKVIDFYKAHQDLIDVGMKWTGILYGAALAANSLAWSVGLIASPVKAAWALISGGYGVMMRVWGVGVKMWQGLTLVADVYETSIASIAASTAAWVLSIGGIVLGAQSIWEVLNGKKFADTWLGQMIDKLLGPGVSETISDISKALGISSGATSFRVGANGKVEETGDVQDETLTADKSGAVSREDTPDAVHNALLGSRKIPQSQLTSPAMKEAAAKQAIAAASPPSEGEVIDVTINSPITITPPAGTTPAQMEKIVKAAVDQQHMTVLRQAGSALRPMVHS